MKLAEAIREAVQTRVLKKIKQVADFMRLKLRLNYEQSLKKVQEVVPTISAGEWDELLYAVDNAISEGRID